MSVNYSLGMPEVLRKRGFRFFFFSREGHEPRHIHVEYAEKYAKFWLEPIELAESRGFEARIDVASPNDRGTPR